MATVWVECWKCDVCGFRWIKTEIWPERCASSLCRSRRWNGKPDELPASAAAGQASIPEQPPDPVEQPKPTMDRLREICAGKLTSPTLPQLSHQAPTVVQPAGSEPCTYEETDYEQGEVYACGLNLHHKSKHTKGRHLRSLY